MDDNESIGHHLKMYPHDLQMYRDAPKGHISLAEFENLGAERLEVLQNIDSISKQMEITSPEELTECLLNGLKCKGLYYFVKLIKSRGCDSNTSADIEIRKRDLISHYVLRLSLCKKKKTLDWFVKLEEKLFKIRFNSLNRYGVEKFLALHNFDYPTLSDEEKYENRENIVAVHEDVDVNNTLFYKIPYLCVRNLIRDRSVYIKRGIAFVPSTNLISVVSQSFKEHLYRDINNSRGAIRNDGRLEPIFKNFFTFTEHEIMQEVNSIPIEKIDEFAKTSYPLCMRIMHEALRKNHHLKDSARFQYGLFLKLIGLSFEKSVEFWQEEFLQRIDLQTFEQRYLYNIKHTHGKVGRRVDYKYISCNTIINSRVGFGEYHGCPYKNMTENTLHSTLTNFGLAEEGIVEIEDLAKNHRYREACSKCFQFTHKSALASVHVSPANYFFCSQDLILKENNIKLRMKKNLAGKEKADEYNAQDRKLEHSEQQPEKP